MLFANRANQLDQQHGHTHGHVEPVEPGQHEEGRTVDTRVQRQTKQLIRLVIFRRLQKQEDDR